MRLEALHKLTSPRSWNEAVRLVVFYTAVAILFTLALDYLFVMLLGTGARMIVVSAVAIPSLLAPPMTLLLALAAMRAHAMQRELERLVHVDPLSGALNRRGLVDFAENALRTRGASGALSMIIMDVDHFKLINDTYGHVAGDAVIAQLVLAVKELPGASDFAVGRFGGDELVVYFIGQSLEDTMILAERLRAMIEHRMFTHEDRRILITISLGVAAADAEDADPEPMLRRADESLYAAKAAGRNRVRAVA